MDAKRSQLTEEELKLIEETERFMEEVYSDPEVANAPLPKNMRENIFREIRAREAEKEKQKENLLTDEDKELIRLGKRYKKTRKLQRYLVLAAALVLAMAFGITSMGGPEKLLEKVNWMIAGRQQTNVDSDHEEVTPTFGMDEEEVYQKIEEEYGFRPVRTMYLPEKIGFVEGEVYKEVSSALLVYGTGEEAKISYNIRLNYQVGSWGKDVEDELLDEYVVQVDDVVINVKKYEVTDGQERIIATFEYQEVGYSLAFAELESEEVEKVINKLYFP